MLVIPAFSYEEQDGQMLRSQAWSPMDLWAMVMALGLGRGLSLDGGHDQLQAPPNFVRLKVEGGSCRLLMAREVLSCNPVHLHLHHPPQGNLEVEIGPWT